MEDPFILDKEDYTRKVHPINDYLAQASFYLATKTGRPKEECLAFVKKSLGTGGEFEFHDKELTYFERENFEDRVKKQTGILKYIMESLSEREIIAPTLTTYVPPDVKESLLVSVIDKDVKNRSLFKKKMFAASMEVEKYKTLIKSETDPVKIAEYTLKEEEFEQKRILSDGGQANFKISNNSYSGAQVSQGTPISNKTAHSSLTSTCRITSSYANANNEKFLAGNRHYKDYETAINNITSICSRVDYEQIRSVVKDFGLKYPSVEEALQCIKRSTDLYFHDKPYLESIRHYLSCLDDVQRAALVYTSDFYHMRAFNPECVRAFLESLSKKCHIPTRDGKAIYDEASDPVKQLAIQICDREMKGIKVSELYAKAKEGDGKAITDSNTLSATIENVYNTISHYARLIRCFFVTENFPTSVSFFPESVRHVVLVSDTDSTIFTVQEWIQWMYGKITHDERSLGLCACIVFLASKTVTHLLAMMSTNLGIEKKRLFQIQMKNEFRFDIFVPTPITKHYYALIGFREGNLFSEFKLEIKGVHLKSSNAPIQVMEKAHALMEHDIMGAVADNKLLSLEVILKTVADIERKVIADVKKGGYEYLRLTQIKDSESYQLEDTQSPFQHYTLWNEVFGPKYGMVSPPPYMAIKVATILNSKRKMQDWMDQLTDRDLAARMAVWLIANDKKNGIGTFQLPDSIVTSQGLPEEVFSALDIRRIVLDATGVYYHVLETLGVYMLDKTRSHLCFDYY